MNTAKFFEDNIARINPQADPLAWNLNCGLLQLAKQLQEVQGQLAAQQRCIRQIEELLRRLPPR